MKTKYRQATLALLTLCSLSGIASAEPFALVTVANSSHDFTNKYADSVVVVDTATNEIVTSIELGQSATRVEISPDGKTALVASESAHRVFVVDISSFKLVGEIPINAPYGIAFTPDGRRAYVASFRGAVSAIDVTTREVISTATGIPYPSDLAMKPDGSFLYATYNEGVAILDTDRDEFVGAVELQAQISAADVAMSPDGGNVFVTAANSEAVIVVSTETNSSVKHFRVEGGSRSVAVTHDGKSVYVVNRKYGEVVQISAESLEAVNTVLIDSDNLGRIAIAPNNDQAYVTSGSLMEKRSSAVYVFDTTTGEVVGKIPLPGNVPTDVAIAPEPQ